MPRSLACSQPKYFHRISKDWQMLKPKKTRGTLCRVPQRKHAGGSQLTDDILVFSNEEGTVVGRPDANDLPSASHAAPHSQSGRGMTRANAQDVTCARLYRVDHWEQHFVGVATTHWRMPVLISVIGATIIVITGIRSLAKGDYWKNAAIAILLLFLTPWLFSGGGTLEDPSKDGLITAMVRRATNDGPAVLVMLPFAIACGYVIPIALMRRVWPKKSKDEIVTDNNPNQ